MFPQRKAKLTKQKTEKRNLCFPILTIAIFSELAQKTLQRIVKVITLICWEKALRPLLRKSNSA